MVAKVNSGRNILGILNYNENKVREGMARCIHENMFGRDVEKLTFNGKRRGLENFIHRNRRATTKAVHISLNFHTSEKLTKDTLSEIATTYMDKIGFGDQPYLVYQHFDAAHPHIHIVTTNIKSDGKRILLYNIGRNQSEKARQQIEKEFNLVKAAGRKQSQNEILSPVNMQQLVYGRSETKRTISNIVRSVTRSYRYTSLPELNAVLSQYNIMADRGKEGSQMEARKGLLYRVIEPSGKKVGVPIKASSIFGKPTLAYLQKQYKLNAALRRPYKERLTNCINDAFGSKAKMRKSIFIKSLNKEGIHVLFRQNEDGRVYGITFVDNKTKVVFNGSDLGKAYSARAITERLTKVKTPSPFNHPIITSPHQHIPQPFDLSMSAKDWAKAEIEQLTSDVIKAESFDHQSPDAAISRTRKKKRKRRRI